MCHGFKRKIFLDQLCYEIDLDKISDVTVKDLSIGLTFLVDVNREREFSSKATFPENSRDDIGK